LLADRGNGSAYPAGCVLFVCVSLCDVDEAKHSGQLSLLPAVGRKMSTGQSAVTVCGWGAKAGMVHSTCRKRVDGR